MTRFHAGPKYDLETQNKLDALFAEWLDLDAVAENRGYDNEARNAAADAKYAEYQQALAAADELAEVQ